jgi:glycosyltransferase involved in cell wall biosynthesis
MAQHPKLDHLVAYCSLRGAEAGHDPEFGTTVQWDVPLLDGYQWVQVPNKGSGNESFWGFYNPGLWSLIRDGKYDAVFCHTGYLRASFWIAWFRSRLSRAAFLFGTDATTLNSMDGRKWKRPVKRLFWPFLYRLASQVIAPSTGTEELMRSLGIPAERISLAPYSVGNDWWLEQSAQVDRKAVRDSWRIPQEAPVVLYCAKLQPWKRPQDLLKAFAKAELPDAYLVIAGAELGISQRSRFLGFVNQSQLPSVYTAADVLVLPSSYEAFGVVVNEASLCGCAVVSSDRVGAARDLIIPVDPGLIYPCGDVPALATLLRKLVSDLGRLQDLGEAARKRMASWSPKETAAGMADAVEVAVRRRG